MRIVDIYLTPRDAKPKSSAHQRREYASSRLGAVHPRQIPKPARKEFEKGVKLDRDGKSDEAIKRYQKASRSHPSFTKPATTWARICSASPGFLRHNSSLNK